MPIRVNLDDLPRFEKEIVDRLRSAGSNSLSLSQLATHVHAKLYGHFPADIQAPPYARPNMVQRVVARMLRGKQDLFECTHEGLPNIGTSANTGEPIALDWRADDQWRLRRAAEVKAETAVAERPPSRGGPRTGLVPGTTEARKSGRQRKPPARFSDCRW